jgi:hypothetical protein
VLYPSYALTTQADWSDRFFGTKMDRGKIVEIQAMVDEIERELR